MSRVTFSALPPGPYDVLRLALEAARLPIDDLTDPDCRFFELASEADPIGVIGLEGRGADRLHLLTQTVPDFFHGRDYRPTAQFASLCPASAIYLFEDIA